MKTLIIYSIIGFGVTVLVLWFANQSKKVHQKEPTTPPTPPLTDPHGKGGEHGHDHPPGKPPSMWDRFWFWFGIIATLVVGIISIAWFINHQSNSRPERKEFSAYYTFQEDDGPTCEVSVKVTPDSISFGFTSILGGHVTGRWTRSGEGIWTRMFGSQHFGSWLRIKNATSNPEEDFKEWKSRIYAEIGDDTDPNKKLKWSFIRQ